MMTLTVEQLEAVAAACAVAREYMKDAFIYPAITVDGVSYPARHEVSPVDVALDNYKGAWGNDDGIYNSIVDNLSADIAAAVATQVAIDNSNSLLMSR